MKDKEPEGDQKNQKTAYSKWEDKSLGKKENKQVKNAAGTSRPTHAFLLSEFILLKVTLKEFSMHINQQSLITGLCDPFTRRFTKLTRTSSEPIALIERYCFKCY